MSKLRAGHILMLVVALVFLGALAWGVGWVAHSLMVRPTTSPTPTAAPTLAVATATGVPATLVPTPMTVSPVAMPPVSTQAPTSTPMPTLAPTPTEEWETVQSGEGLYQVCRRHCPGRWLDYGVPPDLMDYAGEVAQLNGLPGSNPTVYPDQKLRMSPCP